MDKNNKRLFIDAGVLLLSIIISIWFISGGHLQNFLNSILSVSILAAFIAGILFTFFITVPISIATFIILAQQNNPFQVAVIGGLGAMIGDLLIIKIFKDTILKDFHTLSKDLKLQKLFHFFKASHFNHLAPILGAILVMSPFPDEVGLMLLGISKLKYIQLVVLTFVLSTIGIFLITFSADFLTN